MKKNYLPLIILILFSFQNFHAQTVKSDSVKLAKNTALEEYPDIPEELLNSEIILTNDEKIKLADYKDEVIILSFVTEWAMPARTTISDLKKLYSKNLKNVRIIAVDPDNNKSKLQNFKKLVQDFKVEFQSGWINGKFTTGFLKISKFNGIPQSFVIKDGKLFGIFQGASPKVDESLINLVRKISVEEN